MRHQSSYEETKGVEERKEKKRIRIRIDFLQGKVKY
jgi:hypothetical protein